MPESRRSSRGRHRAPAAAAWPRLSQRLHPGQTAKGVLTLALALTLGGYTIAESTTQRAAVAAEQSAVAAADRAQVEIAGERDRAVATARGAVDDATAVQAVASGSVSENELAGLTGAVAQLTALVDKMPGEPVPPDRAASAGAGRASRGVTRKQVPSGTEAAAAVGSTAPVTAVPAAATAAAVPAATAAPDGAAGLAAALAASDAAREAAQSPSTVAPTPLAEPTAAANATQTPADDAAPADQVAARIMGAAARVADLTAQVKTTAQKNVAAAQEAAATAAQVAQAEAQAAAQAAQRASLAGYANGRVPADALCAIEFAAGQQLRCDAAEALARLNGGYRAKFGRDLTVTDSYRSYAAQVACLRTKGRLCATPGTSNHGRGVAVDLGDGLQRFGTVQHAWMADHAGEYGWVLPDWASRSGSKPEPWHWEFTG